MKNYGLQLLLKMTKYSALGLICQMMLFTLVLAEETKAQENKSVKDIYVEIGFENTPLIEVFNKIESVTNFRFTIYENDDYLKQKFSMPSKRTTVEQLLIKISQETGLMFQQINNNIGIKRGSHYELKKKNRVEVILQTRAISGKVVSGDDGQPLPGVNVIEKGTSNGTVTDISGNYKLNVPENATIVFSSVGYTTEEVPVSNRSVIDLTMLPDVKQLQELVVVGYGTVRKSDLTGSISQVKSEDIQKRTLVSMDQALQGLTSGVMVTQASSAPGGGISVRIRGGNSISGGNEPLYVIDGVPVYNNNNEVNPSGGQFNELRTAPNALSSLNPNDIESIEVLKDASATAIYGSRGANGVVLVTTKKGKAGDSRIDFNMYQGVQNVTKKVAVLNSSDLMKWTNEALINNGASPIFDDNEIANPTYNTDWQDEILQPNAPTANYQLSFSGGNENTTYAVSSNYYTQDGIIRKSAFDRYSIRLNLSSKIKDWVSVGENLSFARTINNQAFEGGSGNNNSSALFSALAYIPLLPVYNESTGNYSRREDAANIYPGYSSFGRKNPVHLINEMTDRVTGDRLIGDIYANFSLLKGLNFKTTVGLDLDNRQREYYFSSVKDPYNTGGSASLGYAKALSLINTNLLNYEKEFGVHRLNFTGVYEIQQRTTDRSSISNSLFDNNITQYYDIGAGTQSGGPIVSSNRTKWNMLSYLGRINYSLKDKYLLTVSARADASSKFGKDNKWGFFPSAAIAWRMGEEEFIKNLNLFSTLKLRASAGRTGNQEIGINNSITIYDGGKYSFGGNEVNFYRPRVGNSNLKWETTNQVDVGFEMGFFADRINVSADAYYKKTYDLLMTYNIPVELGYGSTIGNVGTLQNKGIELSIGGWIADNDNFKWRTDFNWAANRNKVLDLGESTELRGSVLSYDYGSTFRQGTLVKVGLPIGSFYGLQLDGLYRTPEEVANNTLKYSGGNVPDVGSARYKDIAGPEDENGNPTAPDGIVDQWDRTYLGDPSPKFIFGWNNTFTYKFIELSALIQGVYGNKILNLNRRDLFDENYQHNISQVRFDGAWREGNELTAKYPKANAKIGIVQRIPAGVYSDFFIEDGSYLRLKDIRLTFNLPFTVLNKIGANSRIYIAGQNLITLTNYTGYNPEVNQQGQNNINQGIDMGSYPLARTYMIGVNLSF